MARRLAVLVTLSAACGGTAPARVQPVPRVELPPLVALPDGNADRVAAARAAFEQGWMPTHAAGVQAFAAAHPAHDGRGVLIAILDSGIDPSLAGLGTTTTGQAKLVDLRDVSGEGRVALTQLEVRADTLVWPTGQRRFGAMRLAGMVSGPIWGGIVVEPALGKTPDADVNGDGDAVDSLPVVVARGTTDWFVMVDALGDNSLWDDRPVRDFAIARETVAWAIPGRAAPLHLAVNLDASTGTPALDLLFDTSGHGSHVAGIAAGHDLYGVTGFDGVAPGARVLGIKLANNAEGGVTVAGSIVSAMDLAIRTARACAMPLVINLSFGVGNEREGAARIDAAVDSILAANPDVVMTIAASNDGPGLSTLGFPGSASRAISVGATQPLVFAGLTPSDSTPDPLAYFSSRGLELAGPDVVVPGVAYSLMPRFAIGNEQSSGTSMAAPFAAGMAARLVGALHAAGRPIRAHAIRQALQASARPVPGVGPLEVGAGEPHLLVAWQILTGDAPLPDLAVAAPTRGIGARAAVVFDVGVARRSADTVRVVRRDDAAPVRVRARATASWLRVVQDTLIIDGAGTPLVVRLQPGANAPGVDQAEVLLETLDGRMVVGRIPVTRRVPLDAATGQGTLEVAAGGAARVVFRAEAARGLRIEVATAAPQELVMVALHEPGGQPFRDGPVTTAGFGDGAALFELDADAVVPGLYEVVVLGAPTAGATATVSVEPAPVTLAATQRADSLELTTRNVSRGAVALRLRTALTGAEWQATMRTAGGEPVEIDVPVPEWAEGLVLDVQVPREAWPTVTDLTATLWHPDGRLIEASPLNYAFGRTVVDVPTERRGGSIRLRLRVAPVATADRSVMEAIATVRFRAERPWALDDGGTAREPLAAGATRTVRFPLTAWPLVIPAGGTLVLTFVALEGDDAVWTREVTIGGAR
jgi:subtilisin family serine protease